MATYILRRALASLPVLLIVGLIAFSLVHMVPGDASAAMLDEDATIEEMNAARKSLGLDKPLIVQFANWFGGLFRGDIGRSVFTDKSVGSMMLPRIQPTVALAIMSVILSVALGVPIGLLAAWKANSVLDRVVMVFAVLGFSVPGFWLAFNLIWLFAVKIDIFPVLGYVSISDGVLPFFRGLALPVISLSVSQMALIAWMTRSSMLEVLSQDYIRTAYAKGMRERVVLTRHALRGASIPVVTVIGLVFASLITGVIVIETVFAIPGIGRLVVDAVLRRDFPVVQGALMVLSVIYVFVNLCVDVVYVYLDPRIRY